MLFGGGWKIHNPMEVTKLVWRAKGTGSGCMVVGTNVVPGACKYKLDWN